jgi:hypothetical protein
MQLGLCKNSSFLTRYSWLLFLFVISQWLWFVGQNDQKFEPINTTIRPGDELVTHCVWDSTNRTTTTLGGESTNNEMYACILIYSRLSSFLTKTVVFWTQVPQFVLVLPYEYVSFFHDHSMSCDWLFLLNFV